MMGNCKAENINRGSLPSQNLLKNKLGSRDRTKSVTDPLQSFSLFIPDMLLEKVAEYINASFTVFDD